MVLRSAWCAMADTAAHTSATLASPRWGTNAPESDARKSSLSVEKIAIKKHGHSLSAGSAGVRVKSVCVVGLETARKTDPSPKKMASDNAVPGRAWRPPSPFQTAISCHFVALPRVFFSSLGSPFFRVVDFVGFTDVHISRNSRLRRCLLSFRRTFSLRTPSAPSRCPRTRPGPSWDGRRRRRPSGLQPARAQRALEPPPDRYCRRDRAIIRRQHLKPDRLDCEP